MNSSEVAQRRELWMRVFAHEMDRRARIAAERPKAYVKVFGQNPKRLKESCEGGEHCWVPATTLWIHDNNGKGVTIAGFKRRGFHEAMPYSTDEYMIVPQICWNCRCTREKLSPKLTWAERQKTLADHIQTAAKGKPRGKQGRDVMLTDLDDLFV